MGIERAPVGDASFWTQKLSADGTDPEHALRAFARIVRELDDADADDGVAIAEAASALIAHMGPDQAERANAVLVSAVNALDWSDPGQEKTRDIAYGLANDARPLIGDAAIDALLAMGIADGLTEAGTSPAFAKEAINRTILLPPSGAARLEEHLASSTGTPLVALRLRIAAASRTGSEVAADDVLALKDSPDLSSELGNEWLALKPTLAEAQMVIGGVSVSIASLGTYATALDVGDRSALSIDCERRGWTISVLKSVGAAGVSSSAIRHIGAKVAASTQQAKRDGLVARLLAAKLDEQPAHTSATELVLQLLATDVLGNAGLAARVAIASGGAAHGKVITVRSAFDSVVAAKPRAITKGEQDRLRAIGLLSQPKTAPNKARRALKGVMGTIRGG